jgi:hypothetical protein
MSDYFKAEDMKWRRIVCIDNEVVVIDDEVVTLEET